ncbi:conserved hypothetical protein [Methanosalsum zhilinae DSM 4017]|uniref:Uncharacterized protein n=1 Tax=Methanosalsum zhilinae (strain DSM 4017 / NBRC 107636 / OCM 62 / WeN5) TaxID=679901 RepID=F7XKE7_METZD|nr:hypothetical protein [Methanosalsum zhilinae]AEH61715.1 conserved hypothetical protein [Methanosalsum zhilinae DSM 4017]
MKNSSISHEEIKLARPCIDEPDRYIAESRFSHSFMMDTLCSILNKLSESGEISGIRCSAKLGVARFEWQEKTILLYRNGRIDIRRAVSVEDADHIITGLQKMIIQAFS